MAVQPANARFVENGLLVVGPAAMANGDTSSPVDCGVRDANISWTAKGTFGVGGSVQLEESNDPTTGFAIVGTASTAAGTKSGVAAGRYLRFNVTAGDGTTALTPVLTVHPARG